MPLVGTKLSVALGTVQTNPLDLVTGRAPVELLKEISLGSGTAAQQADRLFTDRRTLAASASENLDLAGTLADAFGATLTFVKLKAILVIAAAANTNNVNVSREGTSGVPAFLAAGDGVPVLPGGVFLWMAPGAGVTVTPSTGDLLAVANSGAGTSVTYDVYLLGTSA
ncbi:hypothetical protein [Streptomyces sp. NBC_00258]|uniref:hypothetical protein n=1 Tax=Streptomyces sp. NBC_00258 TaxID=2903642 RepID=UPI002E2A8FDD|nr:hypothetical protein [Streptomyces sp. NBC_00258]